MADRYISTALTFVFVAVFAMLATASQEIPGNGVTLPTVVKQVKAGYTEAAKRERIQGSVWLKVVVAEDGSVKSAEVSRSLDDTFGLDQEALKAAKQWEFKPGTKAGKPVDVQVTVEMTFTLK